MKNLVYKFKTEKKKEVKKIIKYKKLADEVGVSASYISCIVNGKKDNISKSLAFHICKTISPDYEIEDLFNIYSK